MDNKSGERVVPEDWVDEFGCDNECEDECEWEDEFGCDDECEDECEWEDEFKCEISKHRTKFAEALEFIGSGTIPNPYEVFGLDHIGCCPCAKAPGGIEKNGMWLPIHLYNTGVGWEYSDRPSFISKPPCYNSVEHKMVHIANGAGRDLRHICDRKIDVGGSVAHWFNEACRCKSCDGVRDAYHLDITGKRPTDIISVVQLRK